MGHYYDVTRGAVDGNIVVTPVYEMQTQAGGIRGTHMGDAKKLLLLPSVTEILGKAVRKPALEKWSERQFVRAFANAPPEALSRFDTSTEEGLNAAAEYYRGIRESLNEKAPQKGNEIHADLERFYNGESVSGDPGDPANMLRMNLVMRVNMRLRELYPRMETERFECLSERPVAGPGYGGRVDLIIYFPDTRTAAPVDYKCVSDSGKWAKWTRPYPEETTQTCAYARSLHFMGSVAGRPIERVLLPSILKINAVDGQVKHHVCAKEDIQKFLEYFRAAQTILAVQENFPLIIDLARTRTATEMVDAIEAGKAGILRQEQAKAEARQAKARTGRKSKEIEQGGEQAMQAGM